MRGLRLKKEELAQVGVRISDKEYLSTIISLLPDALANFVSMQMAWTLQSTSKSMDAETLMTMLLSEAEQQNLRNQRHKPGVGKNKEEENGEVLVVSKDKPQGRKNSEGKILCWNCRKEGHLKPKCPEPQKFNSDSKKASESSKSETKVATVSVVEVVSDDKGAWAAEEVSVDLGKDWFEEVVKEIIRIEFKLIEDVVGEGAGDGNVDEMVAEELGDVSGEAFVVAELVQTLVKAKLYDSGCTNHILPYRSSFSNLKTIETRHFCTGNKQTFSTIRKGELIIDISNNNDITQLRLQDILYSPEVAYMLVSVGRLDEEGFFVTFGGGSCTIRDENKELVGVIVKTASRVYKVEHEEVANEAEERLTLGCFH